MKTKHTATFADGTVLTRSSERTYSHAFRVTVDGGKTAIHQGFASSEAGAKRSAGGLLTPKKSYGGAGDRAYRNRGPVIEVVAVTTE